MNSFVNSMDNMTNYTFTQNFDLAHKTTGSKVYDLFATGGAMRNRSDEDCIVLFKEAYLEDALLALKCLFYLRDARGGQGERRFFRVCFKWLCQNYPDVARKNLEHVSFYGRWDDLIYSTYDTPVFKDTIKMIKLQLVLDSSSEAPSLLGKWIPSENSSSPRTKKMGNIIRTELGATHKQYRKLLSSLRTKINIVEKLMSEGRWDQIKFEVLPSRAGLKYRNAFARRDIIAKRYEEFIKSKDTKVHANVLYPYDVVREALNVARRGTSLNDTDRVAVNKYWENLPDYLNGSDSKILCVIDTSGSMTYSRSGNIQPIHVAIGLGMYAAERLTGDFHNKYISFSSRPQWIDINGADFVDKVRRIYSTNLCSNTDLEATFKLIKSAMKKSDPKDWPTSIVVISDLQFDCMSCGGWTSDGELETGMERMREQWAREGLKMPNLYYWNCNASKQTITDLGPGVSYVSGASPVIFEQVIKGLSGIQLMLNKLNSDRYSPITV